MIVDLPVDFVFVPCLGVVKCAAKRRLLVGFTRDYCYPRFFTHQGFNQDYPCAPIPSTDRTTHLPKFNSNSSFEILQNSIQYFNVQIVFYVQSRALKTAVPHYKICPCNYFYSALMWSQHHSITIWYHCKYREHHSIHFNSIFIFEEKSHFW